MRIPIRYVLAAALLLNGCNRETAPASKTATPATAAAPTPAAAAPSPAKEIVFSQEELDQMTAPVALYPDSLLAQVLMAATYPGNVADAVDWSKAHSDAKGDDAVRQVANQPWDPSVQSLVAFPQVLSTLGQDPAWVQRLGDAFLAQPDDVMNSVQRLRHKAQDAGTLTSNKYQTVKSGPAPAPEAAPATGGVTYESPPQASSTIVIEPADPEVVYVPSYNPTTAYGSWPNPSYPPAYYPPSPMYYAGSALMTGMAFGVGLAITDSLWGDCNWGSNDVDINVSRYNNINTNRQISANDSTWRHNSANREGVPYRDRASREQYGRQLDGADRRDQFRGDDPARAQQRAQARNSMERRGVAPATNNAQARAAAQNANRPNAGNRANQPANRDAARNRAAASTERAQARNQSVDRGQGGQRKSQAQNNYRQQAGNTTSRDAARKQSASRQAPRNNAFAGASSPSSSRSAAQRGQSSNRAAANRSSSNAGRQVNRQSSPPKRQGSQQASRQPAQRGGGNRR